MQPKVNVEVLRDEEILTIVVRQNPFCEFLSQHTFNAFPEASTTSVSARVLAASTRSGTGALRTTWNRWVSGSK